MFLPGCDRCCQCGCACGTLPYTLTVEFGGLVNKTHGQHCSLEFDSLFGCNAEGIVLAPGGCDNLEPCCTPSDRGPITDVLLTNGGKNYAKCGRTEPELVITAPGVVGAVFTPTFDVATVGGLPIWQIGLIEVSGGTGFVDGSPLKIETTNGSFQEAPAIATLYFDGTSATVEIGATGSYYKEDCTLPPIVAEVTVTPCGGGSGAVITATVDDDPTSATFGTITKLNVTEGGDGYLAWNWVCRGWDSLNGLPFVLRASTPRPLVSLEFQSCFGGGACAVIDNKGPREQPTLTASPACGGTVTPTLTKTNDDNGDPAWTITSVSASGGTDCPSTAAAVFSCCCTTIKAADITLNATGGVLTGATITDGGLYYQQREWDGSASPIYSVTLTDRGDGYVKLGREKPQWTITKDGWTFTPAFSGPYEGDCKLPYWATKSVGISSGSKSTALDGWGLTKTVEPPEYVDERMLAVVHTRQEPTVTAKAGGNSGYGATFDVTVEEIGGQPKQWRVASITGGGGTGYPDNVPIYFSVPPRTGAYGHYTVDSARATGTVNETGAITGITLLRPGAYYLDNGIPQTVEVKAGGRYYRENPSLDRFVADVSVVVKQLPGSNGSDAVLTASVDSNPTSENYGKIASVTIENGGDGYSLFGGSLDCLYKGGCNDGCTVGGRFVELEFQGDNKPLAVRLKEGLSVAAFESDEPVTKCDTPPGTASLVYGTPAGTLTITPGGQWDSFGQSDCGDCPCIMDLVAAWQDQPVSITSDCPCKSGTISGSGTIGSFDWDPCVWLTLNGVDIDIEGTVSFGVVCEPHGCNDTGDCVRCVSVYFGSYVYVDGDVIDFAQGTACACDDLTLGEDGFLHGTVVITAVGQTITCTVTIVFG